MARTGHRSEATRCSRRKHRIGVAPLGGGYADARSFIAANSGYAQQIATQVDTMSGDIWGLADFETGSGTNFFVSAGTNNYFGFTAGPAFGGRDVRILESSRANGSDSRIIMRQFSVRVPSC